MAAQFGSEGGRPDLSIYVVRRNLMAKGTRKIGRSAITGRFTTVKKAQQASKTHVVTTIKKPK
jgi:hypothetical protein